MRTPVLTDHARQRCVEMGLSTKEVKQAVQRPDITYVNDDGMQVACRGRLAVVHRHTNEDPDVPLVVTVLWHKEFRRRRDDDASMVMCLWRAV